MTDRGIHDRNDVFGALYRTRRHDRYENGSRLVLTDRLIADVVERLMQAPSSGGILLCPEA